MGNSGPAFLGQGWGIFGSLACAASAAALDGLLFQLLTLCLKGITKATTEARVLQPPRYHRGELAALCTIAPFQGLPELHPLAAPHLRRDV